MSKQKLDDREYRELMRRLEPLKAGAAGPHAKVGILAASSQPHQGSDMSLVEIAAVHEFGSPAANIPERSFIRGTFEERDVADALARLTTQLARAIVARKIEVAAALERLGQWGAAQVKARIKRHIPPPLKPQTIERKGSSTPLVDTGQLINAVTYEVVPK